MTAFGEQVRTRWGSRMVLLEDFSMEQIVQFLTNLFGDESRARDRLDLISDIDNLLDLAHNPAHARPHRHAGREPAAGHATP
jgi:hypothetical protein